MIDVLSVGGVQLHGTRSRGVTGLDGWVGSPGVRGTATDRAENDGAVEPVAQYRSARLALVAGVLVASSVDAVFTDFTAVAAAFEAGMSADLAVLWRPAGSTRALQANARLAGPVLTELSAQAPGAFLRYQAQLRFADPRWYSQVLQSASVLAASVSGGIPFPMPFPMPMALTNGGVVAVTNAGTVETWPLITVAGPINSPTVGNATTNVFLSFDSLNLGAGQTLTITTNPNGRGATVGGTNVQGSLNAVKSNWPSVRASATDWFQLYGAGGISGATTLTVTWRDAWVG